MGLETATFVIDLTTTNPPASDPRGQGDDHIRLIKAALKNTFPTADRPFYFPKTEATAVTLALDATDQNNMVHVDTSGGNVAITLPGTLGSGDKGWECEVMKTSVDANAAIVSPASGTIASKCGSTATIRVGILCEPARFIWNGSAWYCSKPGPMIGSTENFDGASLPPGYLLDDGSSFSNTAFAELFAVLGSSTLKDKRGRVEAGVDSGGVRLTAAGLGAAATLGAVGGVESGLLAANQIPTHTSVNAAQPITVNPVGNVINKVPYVPNGSFSGSSTPGGATNPLILYSGGSVAATSDFSGNNSISTTYTNGAQQVVKTPQPTIVVNKIKRAC